MLIDTVEPLYAVPLYTVFLDIPCTVFSPNTMFSCVYM